MSAGFLVGQKSFIYVFKMTHYMKIHWLWCSEDHVYPLTWTFGAVAKKILYLVWNFSIWIIEFCSFCSSVYLIGWQLWQYVFCQTLANFHRRLTGFLFNQWEQNHCSINYPCILSQKSNGCRSRNELQFKWTWFDLEVLQAAVWWEPILINQSNS